MKMFMEILNLFKRMYCIDEYEKYTFIPKYENINMLLKEINMLNMKLDSLNDSLYLDIIRDILYHLVNLPRIWLLLPGFYINNFFTKTFTKGIVLKNTSILKMKIQDFRKYMHFLKKYIDRGNSLSFENLYIALYILRNVLKILYRCRRDLIKNILIEVEREMNFIQVKMRDIDEYKDIYSEILKNLYYIDNIQAVENNIDLLLHYIKVDIRQSSFNINSRNVSIILKNIKLFSSNLFSKKIYTNVYVKNVPIFLRDIYFYPNYTPTRFILNKAFDGIVWINPFIKNIDKEIYILLLAHETYFGHHLHLNIILRENIPILSKIYPYLPFSMIMEGYGVLGEHIFSKMLGEDFYKKVFIKNYYIRLMRAKCDILYHKYRYSDKDLEKIFPLWVYFKNFSKLMPGYWLNHVLGYQLLLNTFSKTSFKNYIEYMLWIGSLGTISKNIFRKNIEKYFN